MGTTTSMTDLVLLRLLQLVNPGLPIGMFCYSQGLETAVEEGVISNRDDTAEWVRGIMQQSLTRVDLPFASRFYDAWQGNNTDSLQQLSRELMAYRETSELREEDRHTGQALASLLTYMQISKAESWNRFPYTTLVAMFTCAARHWKLDKTTTLSGYLWSWLENQILCAVKLVPLGQVAGQQLLYELATDIPGLVEQALTIDDHNIGGSAFAQVMLSSRHETQYSRLFRS